MAFFRKKKGDVRRTGKHKAKQMAETPKYPAESLTITSLVSPTSFDDSIMGKGNKRQTSKRWITPRSHSTNKTPSTIESSLFGSRTSSLLGSLNVVATDDIEITTLESQQALVQQREAIRRQLFDLPSKQRSVSPKSRSVRSVLYRTATNASQEILPNGNIIPDTPSSGRKLSASLASLPLSSVSQSFESSSHDGSHIMVPIELATRSYEDSYDRKQNRMERSLTDRRSNVTPVSSPSKKHPEDPLSRRGKSAMSPISPNTSHSSRPMDERQVDREMEYQRNKGKSPLKGMPDDERLEYQRDEIDHDDSIPMDETRNDSHYDGEESTSSHIEEEEYSVSARRKQTGLAAGGALVAAAVGWGAKAVDQACIGDDDLEEEPLRANPSMTNHRPRYLSEAECKKFLRRITRNGFVLLNLIVNGESWTGRTVTMCIAKGSQEHPAQLEWTTVTGGQNHEIMVSSVDLMDILTIDTDGIPEDMEDDTTVDGDNCIFTITTDDGNVFLFEANSKDERDRIVNGLKTIIARWARQMVAGEVTATSELYAVYQTPKLAVRSELSVSPNPTYTMNRMAHRLLDL